MIVGEVTVVVGRIPAIPDRANTEGDIVSYQVAASDPHGITYSAVGLPAGLSIDPNTGVISGTITTDTSDVGSYPVDITTTSIYGSLTQSLDWQVNPLS